MFVPLMRYLVNNILGIVIQQEKNDNTEWLRLESSTDKEMTPRQRSKSTSVAKFTSKLQLPT